MRNHTGKLCLSAARIAALLTLCQLIASAQTSTISAVTPPGVATAPVSGAGVEQYNSFNGSLELSIPLHHIGGRGEGGFDLLWNLQPNWVAAYSGPNPGSAVIAAQYPAGRVSNNLSNNQNSSGLLGPGAVYIRTGYTWTYCNSGASLHPSRRKAEPTPILTPTSWRCSRALTRAASPPPMATYDCVK